MVLLDWWETRFSKRWQKSLVPYNKALRIYKEIYTEDQPCSQMAACYLSLGSAYSYTGQHLLAIENYRKAADIEVRLLPPLHPAFAYCYSKLGFTFARIEQTALAIVHFEMALDVGLKSLPPGHPLIIELYYVLGTIHKKLNHTRRSGEYFNKQIELLNGLNTSAVLMVDVVEISDGKIHYVCPQCHLPVWVYPSCRMFKGKRCTRCIREMLPLCRNVRVSPISSDQ